MLDIQRVLKQDRLVRALTGLNRKAFDQLLDAFSPVYGVEPTYDKKVQDEAVTLYL